MSYPKDNGTVGLHVGYQQSPCNKGFQLRTYGDRQVVLVDQPSGGMTFFVNGDEPEQPGHHLITRAMTYSQRVGQRSISLTDERTLDSAELVIAYD